MIGYSKTLQVGPKKKSQTEKNKDANKKLDDIYKEKGIFDICEVKVAPDCLKVARVSSVGTELKMTYAHRHKRDWYKVSGRGSLLHSYSETLRCCLPCHMIIEQDRKLTNKLFTKLRAGNKDGKIQPLPDYDSKFDGMRER